MAPKDESGLVLIMLVVLAGLGFAAYQIIKKTKK